MNAELAAKSIPPRTRDISLQHVSRFDVDCHAIDRGKEACEAALQRQLRAHEVEFWTLSLDASLQAEIDRAECKPRQPRRSGDRAQVGDTAYGSTRPTRLLFSESFARVSAMASTPSAFGSISPTT